MSSTTALQCRPAMRFPYHDSHDAAFERLVHGICVYLLGPTVELFSPGPDGERDARFEGTAERYPSAAGPYQGRFVAQAKHTDHPYAHFSDVGFSSEKDKGSTISKEIHRIRSLVERGKLDHYLLFTNRRAGAEAADRIEEWIKRETDVKSVKLVGLEVIDQHVQRDPNLLDRAGMAELRSPLLVTPDDLASIISRLEAHKELFVEGLMPSEIRRTRFEEKNRINGVSEGFSKWIRREYLPYFDQVRDFLGHPDNTDLQRRYDNAAVEFQEQLLAHGEGQPLDKSLVNLHRILFNRDSELARNKRKTKLVIYYMYWNCDLGEDAPC